MGLVSIAMILPAPHSTAPWITERPTPPIPKIATLIYFNDSLSIKGMIKGEEEEKKKKKKERKEIITVDPFSTFAVLIAAPYPVEIPHPKRQTRDRFASLLILATEISATTFF